MSLRAGKLGEPVRIQPGVVRFSKLAKASQGAGSPLARGQEEGTGHSSKSSLYFGFHFSKALGALSSSSSWVLYTPLLFLQPLQELGRVVGDDDVSTCSAEGGHGLQHGSLEIKRPSPGSVP